MGETKHSRGPFTAKGPEVFSADGYRVASTDGVHLKKGWKAKSGQHWGTTPGAAVERPEDEEEANAVLFAAAPEMFEALTDWLAVVDGSGIGHADDCAQELDNVVAAHDEGRPLAECDCWIARARSALAKATEGSR